MSLLCKIANGIRLSMTWFIDIIDGIFNRGKLVRRIIVIFAIYEINYAVQESLPRLDDGNLVTALMGVIGILATVLAFYTVERNRGE